MDNVNTQALIRFGLGAGPNDQPDADPRGALKAQLVGPDPGLASGAFNNLPAGLDGIDAIKADATQRKSLRLAGQKAPAGYKPLARQYYEADAAAQLGFAATTTAGFRERLVWFWTNHFTVSIFQGQTAGVAGPMIREAIRPHVTGNFTDMVLAAERHSAMLRYLDNDQSIGPDSLAGMRTGKGLNENLGRECMELHTVGLKAGYTQADVTNMAKLLTGWSIAGSAGGGDSTGYRYRPNAHEPGPQTVLGQVFDGGEQAGINALTFLSTYPTTYQLIAAKLVTHFVADMPPPDAVARVAGILRDTGGDLAAASAALVDLPDAWAPLTKLKTPQEYVISALRAAPPGVALMPAAPPVAGTDAMAGDAMMANGISIAPQPATGPQPMNILNILTQLGQPLWGAPLPNGWPDQAASWDGSDAILSRVDWAFTYGARLDKGNAGLQPSNIAAAALGPYLRPATANAIATAGTRREAITILFSAPEFMRR